MKTDKGDPASALNCFTLVSCAGLSIIAEIVPGPSCFAKPASLVT